MTIPVVTALCQQGKQFFGIIRTYPVLPETHLDLGLEGKCSSCIFYCPVFWYCCLGYAVAGCSAFVREM